MPHAVPCIGCGHLVAAGRCPRCAIRPVEIPPAVRRAVLERDGHVCQICLEAPATTIDHRVPRRDGGSDHPSNLQAACLSCNSRKGARAA